MFAMGKESIEFGEDRERIRRGLGDSLNVSIEK
jgi:hypothetical protein